MIGLDGPPTVDCVPVLVLLLVFVVFPSSIFVRDDVDSVVVVADGFDGFSIFTIISAATKGCPRIFSSSAATAAGGLVGRKRKPPRALSCDHAVGLPVCFLRGLFFVVVVVAGIGSLRFRQRPLKEQQSLQSVPAVKHWQVDFVVQ